MRIRAIDWTRGLVMMLMTIDHAGSALDAAHMHGDHAAGWVPGSELPAGEFLTRWITHLCAPTFVLLAGVSLALSTEKRRGTPGQSAFIIKRGLLIVALDPLWQSLAFTGYDRFVFQVLYAIGLSMVCMAGLRHLPARVLLAGGVLIQLFGEFSSRWHPEVEPLRTIWTFLFVGGAVTPRVVVGYPLLPWLSIMMIGWALGRWLLAHDARAERVRMLALVGVGLLVAFVVVRGHDGYGNWHLHRDSLDILQWLHVNKYPPSISFTTLELGLAFLVLAGFMALDDPARRDRFAVLSLFGATAFFYYLLHAHLIAGVGYVLHLDRHSDGLAKTWIAAVLTPLVLAGPCWFYRRYKTAHPDSWTRYI